MTNQTTPNFVRLNPGFGPNFEPTPQMNDEVTQVDVHEREPKHEPPEIKDAPAA